jgi:hypothetical protein
MQNAATTHVNTPATDLETLQHLNANYIRSVRTSDVRWFAENLAEDFLNSNPDGSLVDRARFLEQVAPGGPRTPSQMARPEPAATPTSGPFGRDAGSACQPTSPEADTGGLPLQRRALMEVCAHRASRVS